MFGMRRRQLCITVTAILWTSRSDQGSEIALERKEKDAPAGFLPSCFPARPSWTIVDGCWQCRCEDLWNLDSLNRRSCAGKFGRLLNLYFRVCNFVGLSRLCAMTAYPRGSLMQLDTCYGWTADPHSVICSIARFTPPTLTSPGFLCYAVAGIPLSPQTLYCREVSFRCIQRSPDRIVGTPSPAVDCPDRLLIDQH